MAKLTEKQDRFAHNYVELGNATEAARRAGYSDKTAFVIGHQNLQKKAIIDRVHEIADSFKSDQIAGTKEVLARLTKIGRGQAMDENIVTEKKPVKHKVKNKKGEYEDKIFYEDVSHIELTKVSNSDQNRSLQMLGKHYALFTDKHDVGGSDIPIKIVNDIPENNNDDKGDKDDKS